MYLAIIILPILGSIVSGFFGRKVGVSGAQLITSTCVIVSTLLAIVAFFEVGLNNIPVSIELFRWIDSESLNVSWGFHFDSLTVSMLLPVLIVSSLVHCYSIGYMSSDPHNKRFFSYLSLLTFMMIILITSNNFLLMFVGGLGVGICSYLLLNFWFTIIPGNKSALPPLSKNILQKYPKLTAVLISSAIATLVGISIRMFFLWYLGLDLLNFPLHPILCSINLFSFNFLRFAIKFLLEEWLLPSNVLMMNNTGEGSTSASTALIMNKTVESSTSASTAPTAGTAKSATGSPDGSIDIDALLERAKNLDKSLKKSVSDIQSENYIELIKIYSNLCDNKINYVNIFFRKYTVHMDISQAKKSSLLQRDFNLKVDYFNREIDLLDENNDPLGVKRISLQKQKFEFTMEFQDKAGNLIRESVLNAFKQEKITKQETKEFLASWVRILNDRPELKGEIFRALEKIENKAKSMNPSEYRGKKD